MAGFILQENVCCSCLIYKRLMILSGYLQSRRG